MSDSYFSFDVDCSVDVVSQFASLNLAFSKSSYVLEPYAYSVEKGGPFLPTAWVISTAVPAHYS